MTTELRRACFESGGDDYVEKCAPVEELVARARARVERSYQLRLLATRDPLTHLLNRRGFVQEFEARLEEATRKGQPLAIGLLDLDRFKQINDVYGHLVGDQVIARLGSFLDRRVRAYDLAGRWGGEEFVVAFYGESGATVEAVLGEYLAGFATIPFESAADEIFFASFSGGVATAPGDGSDLASLIRVADQRLYQAKELGRSRIVSG